MTTGAAAEGDACAVEDVLSSAFSPDATGAEGGEGVVECANNSVLAPDIAAMGVEAGG